MRAVVGVFFRGARETRAGRRARRLRMTAGGTSKPGVGQVPQRRAAGVGSAGAVPAYEDLNRRNQLGIPTAPIVKTPPTTTNRKENIDRNIVRPSDVTPYPTGKLRRGLSAA